MPTITPDKLAEIRQAKAEVRDRQAAIEAERSQALQAWEAADGASTDSPEFQALEAVNERHRDTSAELASLTSAELATLEARGGSAVTVEDRRAGQPDLDAGRFALADDVRGRLAQAATSRARFGQIDAGEAVSADRLAAEIGTASVGGLIQPDRRGLQPTVQAPLDVLSLMATGTTVSNSIEYLQSVGINTGAQETPEGQLKPELSLAFTEADAPIRTIAGWIKARKQVLEDAPALEAFIREQVLYASRRRLNDQAMAGNGTGENLRGLLSTSGVQTATVVAGDNVADRILKAITALVLADMSASAAVVNPVDWQAIMLLRENGANGGYVFGGPAGTTQARVWGLPVVATRAVPAGTALVGDFRQAQIMFRHGANVLFSDSDQDDFVKNRVTILGELRAGLVVWRPDGFCKVNLGAVS